MSITPSIRGDSQIGGCQQSFEGAVQCPLLKEVPAGAYPFINYNYMDHSDHLAPGCPLIPVLPAESSKLQSGNNIPASTGA